MSKKITKERIFEVTARLDKTFKPKLNEEMNLYEESRPLYQIAQEIRKDWGNKIYFGAVPYLQAMMSLSSIDDRYGMDSAKSIVLYFLSNAATWRGETAKRIKTELKQMAGLKEEVMYEEEVAPENIAVSAVGGVVEKTGLEEGSGLGTPINKYVYFAYNYPPNFIAQAWADNTNMGQHLQEKFSGYYTKYGAEGVMNRFYVELSTDNQKILEDWILANYKG